MSAYPFPMSLQKLFAIIIALSVVFAPSVAYADMPMAMASQHQMQMMEMGHCEAPPSKSDGKAPMKNCCISMCMAVAITPETPADFVEPQRISSYFAVPTSWHGHLAEIATPPPRLS